MSEGRHKFSLRFQSRQTEAFFVASNSERLLQHIFASCLVGIVASGVVLIYVIPNLPPGAPGVTALVIGADVSGIAMLGLTGLFTTSSRLVACVSPEMREVAVVFLMAYCMTAIFMVDLFYAAKLLGLDPDAVYGDTCVFSDTRPLLALCCVMTGAHLTMPIRWVILLPLEVFSCLVYAAYAFILGGPDGVGAWSSVVLYAFLVLVSAIGRRAIEHHEREALCLLIQERSLRASTEHRLTRMEEASQSHLPEDQRSTRESRPETTDSAAEFVRASESGDLAGVSAIGRREEWLIDFEELKMTPGYVLGQGSFGKVVAGFYAGSPAAIKLTVAISRDDGETNLNHSLLVSVLNEMRIMRRLHHPNICSFYGASLDRRGSCVALVLEWVHGPSLEKFILQRGMPNNSLRVSDQFKAIMDTCSAVRYLHSRQPQVVHGDLKGTNIIIERNPSHPRSIRAKLLDFGLSRVLTRHAGPLSGTAMWVAPEVVQHPGAPAQVQADVFSFARLSFFVLTGRFPFSTNNRQLILQKIRSGSLPPLPWPRSCSALLSEWRSWIESCSLQAAGSRPCMGDIALRISETLDKQDSEAVQAVWGLPEQAIKPLESFGVASGGIGRSASEQATMPVEGVGVASGGIGQSACESTATGQDALEASGQGASEAQRAHTLHSL